METMTTSPTPANSQSATRTDLAVQPPVVAWRENGNFVTISDVISKLSPIDRQRVADVILSTSAKRQKVSCTLKTAATDSALTSRRYRSKRIMFHEYKGPNDSVIMRDVTDVTSQLRHGCNLLTAERESDTEMENGIYNSLAENVVESENCVGEEDRCVVTTTSRPAAAETCSTVEHSADTFAEMSSPDTCSPRTDVALTSSPLSPRTSRDSSLDSAPEWTRLPDARCPTKSVTTSGVQLSASPSQQPLEAGNSGMTSPNGVTSGWCFGHQPPTAQTSTINCTDTMSQQPSCLPQRPPPTPSRPVQPVNPQVAAALDNMTVTRLRTECRQRRLPVSGRKRNLVGRLLPFADAILESTPDGGYQPRPLVTASKSPVVIGDSALVGGSLTSPDSNACPLSQAESPTLFDWNGCPLGLSTLSIPSSQSGTISPVVDDRFRNAVGSPVYFYPWQYATSSAFQFDGGSSGGMTSPLSSMSSLSQSDGEQQNHQDGFPDDLDSAINHVALFSHEEAQTTSSPWPADVGCLLTSADVKLDSNFDTNLDYDVTDDVLQSVDDDVTAVSLPAALCDVATDEALVRRWVRQQRLIERLRRELVTYRRALEAAQLETRTGGTSSSMLTQPVTSATGAAEPTRIEDDPRNLWTDSCSVSPDYSSVTSRTNWENVSVQDSSPTSQSTYSDDVYDNCDDVTLVKQPPDYYEALEFLKRGRSATPEHLQPVTSFVPGSYCSIDDVIDVLTTCGDM